MKSLCSISVLAIVLLLTTSSCKKDRSASPNGNPNPNPNTATITPQDLFGRWYWDSTETYSGGILSNTLVHNRGLISGFYPSIDTCYYDFLSSYTQATTNTFPQVYEGSIYASVWYYNQSVGSYQQFSAQNSSTAISWRLFQPLFSSNSVVYNPSTTMYMIADNGPISGIPLDANNSNYYFQIHDNIGYGVPQARVYGFRIYIETCNNNQLTLQTWYGNVAQGTKTYYHR